VRVSLFADGKNAARKEWKSSSVLISGVNWCPWIYISDEKFMVDVMFKDTSFGQCPSMSLMFWLKAPLDKSFPGRSGI
jgi:hypothetical protein